MTTRPEMNTINHFQKVFRLTLSTVVHHLATKQHPPIATIPMDVDVDADADEVQRTRSR